MFNILHRVMIFLLFSVCPIRYGTIKLAQPCLRGL